MHAKRLALLVVLAAGTVLAGCTSSSDGAAPTTTAAPLAPAKAEYVVQANKVCTDISSPMRETMDAVDLEDPDAVDEAVTTVLLPAERTQLAQVRALGFPKGDQALLEKAFAAAEREFDRIEADPSLALEAGSDEFQAQASVLADYGLTECA